MDVLYQFLTGTEFKHRIGAIVDNYGNLKSELDKEKRSTQARWARQEKAIEMVVGNTAGLYGDLQGIVGGALGSIPQLEAGDEEGEADA